MNRLPERPARKFYFMVPTVLLITALILPVAVYVIQDFAAQIIEDRENQEVAEARMRHEAAQQAKLAAYLIPDEGSTLEQIAAVRIGMTAEEVKDTLDYPYTLGNEMFPHGMQSGDHYWVVHDIPVANQGYIQAVFIDKILVGFGCVEPADSRLCKGCLDAMLAGDRPWDQGLPCMIDDVCPECGGTEPVPLGAVLSNVQQR